MKIFNWYIAKSLLLNIGMALGVLVFVMLGTHFFRAFDLLARGVSPLLLGKMLLYLLPDVLRFALPLSLLIACVLVFSRMSAENEISALQASGVSLWQIISPGLLISAVLSVVCFVISMFISPDCRYQVRQLQWEALVSSPLAMLEPGVSSSLSANSVVRIGGRKGNVLHDVHLFETDSDGNRLRDVTAQTGIMLNDPEQRRIELVLKNFTLSEYDLLASGQADSSLPFLQAETMTIPLDYGSAQNQKPLARKLKMMSLKMIFADIGLVEAAGGSITRHLIEFHYRLVLSMSPFAFLVLGVPFGIRNKRSETSTGLLICVLLALVFYAFLLLADSLKDYRHLHPELILWLPNLLYQIGGLLAIRRISSH
ncbi:MAG: LptF/LptG family permease [Lentisphaeria bacterium]